MRIVRSLISALSDEVSDTTGGDACYIACSKKEIKNRPLPVNTNRGSENLITFSSGFSTAKETVRS